MAIGKRIKFFRNRKNLTQKQLGEQLGFMGRTSDVRMAQYESEARIPKHNLVKEMAGILGVNSHALTVPDLDTDIGLMHTLFALEDIHGFHIAKKDGHIFLCLDSSDTAPTDSIHTMLQTWQQQAEKLENGEISKKEYDEWRYRYPELDTSQH
jgi:transcriptional regulator with XRE-family HTH domain